MAETVDTRVEDDGATLELQRRGDAYDVMLDGRRVIASDARRAERQLVELALAPLRDRDDVTLLLAGLGMGFTLRAALDAPNVRRVDVVESSAAMLEWEARHFAQLNGDALRDARVTLHRVELATFLKQIRLGAAQNVPPDGWLAIVLDLDEGPARPWRRGNEAFFTDEGLERLEMALRPGGVLALWSAAREPELARRMHARLQNVAEIAVPVEAEGAGLDYVYRGRKHAPPPSKPAN
jgi:spermidine synthase